MVFTPDFWHINKGSGRGPWRVGISESSVHCDSGPLYFLCWSVQIVSTWIFHHFSTYHLLTLFCLSENYFPQSTCGKNLVSKHRVLLKSCHGKPSLAPPTRIGFLKSWLSSTAWRVGLLCLGFIKKATGAWSGFLFAWTAPPSAHCITMATGSPNLPFCFLWGSYPLCPFPLQWDAAGPQRTSFP